MKSLLRLRVLRVIIESDPLDRKDNIEEERKVLNSPGAYIATKMFNLKFIACDISLRNGHNYPIFRHEITIMSLPVYW